MTANIGHNSQAAVQDEPATRFAKNQLKAIIERVERVEEEIKALQDDRKFIGTELKESYFKQAARYIDAQARQDDMFSREAGFLAQMDAAE